MFISKKWSLLLSLFTSLHSPSHERPLIPRDDRGDTVPGTEAVGICGFGDPNTILPLTAPRFPFEGNIIRSLVGCALSERSPQDPTSRLGATPDPSPGPGADSKEGGEPVRAPPVLVHFVCAARRGNSCRNSLCWGGGC